MSAALGPRDYDLRGPLTLEDFQTLANLLRRFETHHADSGAALAVVKDAQLHVRRVYCDRYVPGGQP